MVRSNGIGYDSNISDRHPANHASPSGLGSSNHPTTSNIDTITSRTPLKSAASFASSRTTAAPLTSIQSRCEGGVGGGGGTDGFSRSRRERPDHFDLELGQIDGEPSDVKNARVRVESAFEQREERV
jgi:hypothetical protein